MATPTLDEYLQANGLPLDNPAVDCISDLSWLYRGPGYRGDPGLARGRTPGELAQPVMRGAKTGPVVLEVHGDVDFDGNAVYGTIAEGLDTNIGELKRLLQPPQNSWTGTYLVEHVHPARTTRQAQGSLRLVDEEWIAPTVARLTYDAHLPGGVLYDTAEQADTSGSVSAATNLTIANPGTADQDALVLTLTGTATSVLLESRTWDASGDTYLDVAIDLSAGAVTIDTAAKTVTQGGADKHGLVAAGMPFWGVWLPLAAGVDNTLRIVPTGGDVTVDTSHYPAWL